MIRMSDGAAFAMKCEPIGSKKRVSKKYIRNTDYLLNDKDKGSDKEKIDRF